MSFEKTHTITFKSITGKDVVFELLKESIASSTPVKFPVTGYRLNGSTSEYGFGYHNQACTLNIVDENDSFYNLFNQNVNKDIQLRILFDGKRIFKGVPEVERLTRKLKDGKQEISVTFYTQAQFLSEVKSRNLKTSLSVNSYNDGGGFGWIRFLRFFERVVEEIFDDELDIALSHNWLSNVPVDNTLLPSSISPSGEYNILNNLWFTTSSLDNDGDFGTSERRFMAFLIEISRIFSIRFGWSWELQKWCFFQVYFGKIVNSDQTQIFTMDNSGDLRSKNISLNEDDSVNAGLKAGSAAIYGNEIVTGSEEVRIYGKDLNVISSPFDSKSGSHVKAVDFDGTDIVYAFERDITTPAEGEIRSKQRSGAPNWTYVSSALEDINTVALLSRNIQVGVGTDTKMIVLNTTGNVVKTVSIGVSKIKQSINGNDILVGRTNGQLRVYDTDFDSYTSVVLTGTINEISYMKNSNGYLITAGTRIYHLDLNYNVVRSINFGLNARGISQFSLNDKRVVVSLNNFIRVLNWDDFSTFVTYSYPAPNAFIFAETIETLTDDEFLIQNTDGTKETVWSNKQINTLTPEPKSFQFLDKTKFAQWPEGKDNAKVASSSVNTNEVSFEIDDNDTPVEIIIPRIEKEFENDNLTSIESIYYDSYIQPITNPWRGSVENYGYSIKTFDDGSEAAIEAIRNNDIIQDINIRPDLPEAINREYVQIRKDNMQRIAGAYSGLLDPMIPFKYENKVFLITEYEFDLRREETIIKKSHQLSNK